MTLILSPTLLCNTITGYTIENACLFDGSSDYLSRAISTTSNRTTYTLSFWMKRWGLGTECKIVVGAVSGWTTPAMMVELKTDDTIKFYGYGTEWILNTSAAFRDTAGWMHVCCVVDSNNGTSTERARLYVNGERVTAFSSETYPSSGWQDNYWNVSGQTASIGRSNSQYAPVYLAEYIHVDGQALTASDFGEFIDSVWGPVGFTGTYGTNGFKLDFSNASDLGEDSSGKGNDWTVNGSPAQVSDSATNDAKADVGSFATLNLIYTGASGDYTLSNGNLTYQNVQGYYGAPSTIGLKASEGGRFRFETTMSWGGSATRWLGFCGQTDGNRVDATTPTGADSFVILDKAVSIKKKNDGGSVSTEYSSLSWSSGQVVDVLVDFDAGSYGEITFKVNGTTQGAAVALPDIGSDLWFFFVGAHSSISVDCNFGQTAFTNTEAGYNGVATHYLTAAAVTSGTAGDGAFVTCMASPASVTWNGATYTKGVHDGSIIEFYSNGFLHVGGGSGTGRAWSITVDTYFADNSRAEAS